MKTVLLVLLYLSMGKTIAGQRETWISFKRFAYWFSPPGDNRNITEAIDICAQKNGSLAEVRTEEIQFFLNQTIQNDTGEPTDFYFGLQREPGQLFSWPDGSSPSYANWDENFPRNVTSDFLCATLSPLQWRDRTCSNATGYICQRNLDKRGVWVPYGHLEYYVSPPDMTRTYNDSEEYCTLQNASLAFIRTAEIQAFIDSLVVEDSDRPYGRPYAFYIGLKYDFEREQFIWNDNVNLIYDNWDVQRPTDDLDETCVVAGVRSGIFRSSLNWRNYECYKTYGFICQRPTSDEMSSPLTGNETATVTSPLPGTLPENGFTLDLNSLLIGMVIMMGVFIPILLTICIYHFKISKRKRDIRESIYEEVSFDRGPSTEVSYGTRSSTTSSNAPVIFQSFPVGTYDVGNIHPIDEEEEEEEAYDDFVLRPASPPGRPASPPERQAPTEIISNENFRFKSFKPNYQK